MDLTAPGVLEIETSRNSDGAVSLELEIYRGPVEADAEAAYAATKRDLKAIYPFVQYTETPRPRFKRFEFKPRKHAKLTLTLYTSRDGGSHSVSIDLEPDAF